MQTHSLHPYSTTLPWHTQLYHAVLHCGLAWLCSTPPRYRSGASGSPRAHCSARDGPLRAAAYTPGSSAHSRASARSGDEPPDAERRAIACACMDACMQARRARGQGHRVERW
jgi:hypothetical protein